MGCTDSGTLHRNDWFKTQDGYEFRELTKEGLAAKVFERVHAPIGLDIGAVTPEEIAVAITAELIAVRRRVERDLPHMSWFHRHKSSDQAISEIENDEPNEDLKALDTQD